MVKFAHIGLPKAASSFLQWGLFRYHPQLHVVGPYPESQPLLATVDELRRDDTADVEALGQQFRQLADEMLDPDRMWGVADERLSGNLLADKRRVRNAERLRMMYGDIKIVMILRHPLTYLRSAYNQSVRIGETKTLNQLIRETQSRDEIGMYGVINYPAMIELYQGLFGKDNVLYLPMEFLREDETGFLTHITDFLAIDPGTEEQLSMQKRKTNIGDTTITLETYRFFNRFGDRRANPIRYQIARKVARQVRHVIDRPRWASKRGPVTMAEIRQSEPLAHLLQDEHFLLWENELEPFNYKF